jgi:predicted ATP-dependent serine protease
MEFETIGLQGKYRELIGDPSVGFMAMVYGLPKSGKSTMCLDFANHLAQNHGKVLFCPIEEGYGYTLQEKIDRLGASHPNLFIAEQVPEDLSEFNFVFIDSVSKAGMEISDITALHKKFPRTAFIFIYHSTKEGKFRGGNEHAHEVDVIIEVVNGEASSVGRFNSKTKIKIS